MIKADNFESVEKGTVDPTLTFTDKEECSCIVLQLALTLLQDVTPSGISLKSNSHQVIRVMQIDRGLNSSSLKCA